MMSVQSSCLLKLATLDQYKLVFSDLDDDISDSGYVKDFDTNDKLFEICSDFEYENCDDNYSFPVEDLKNSSLQRYKKKKKRKLPRIPENKKPLSNIIGKVESEINKIIRPISSNLYIEIKLDGNHKPVSLQLINKDLLDKESLINLLHLKSNEIEINNLNSKIEGNYRGLHKFIARHSDEISIDIGDELFVIKQEDDLWYKGINLTKKCTGYFPSLYVIDCEYNEIFETNKYNFSSTDDDSGLNCDNSLEYDFKNNSLDWLDSDKENYFYFYHLEKFDLNFLGSLEVCKPEGVKVIEQCISKVIQTTKNKNNKNISFPCILEINDSGLRFYKNQLNENNESVHNENTEKKDLTKQTNEDYFFKLKNLTFCESKKEYFSLITKHPKLNEKYACHVFKAKNENLSKDICEAVGKALHRFYLNYIELSQSFCEY